MRSLQSMQPLSPGRYKATIIKTTRIVKSKKDKPVTYFLRLLGPLE